MTSGRMKICAVATPSTCISRIARSPAAAAIITGGNTAGTLAEATSTSRNSAAAPGFGLAAMAPMSHTTGRCASRLVETTRRRRPRRCSAAIRARNSGVT